VKRDLGGSKVQGRRRGRWGKRKWRSKGRKVERGKGKRSKLNTLSLKGGSVCSYTDKREEGEQKKRRVALLQNLKGREWKCKEKEYGKRRRKRLQEKKKYGGGPSLRARHEEGR